jgi:uncharacterized protein (DUF697 family)
MAETEPHKPNILELAKQGHPKAIAFLLNRHLEPKGIQVKSTLSNNSLKLMFEAERIIPQSVLVEWLKVSLLRYIISDLITEVIIYCKKVGCDFPDWQEEIPLYSLQNIDPKNPDQPVDSDSNTPKLTESFTSKMMEFGSLFNSIPTVTEQVKNNVAETVNNVTHQAGLSVIETAMNIQGSVGNLSQSMMEGGKLAFGSIFNRKDTVKNINPNPPSQTRTEINGFNNNPLLKSIIKTLNVDKIFEIIEQVDLAQVETKIQQLKTEYPHESSRQISHRIMVAKVVDLGTSEIASKFVSERLSTLIGVDAQPSQTLEFEMIYEIAYAYGLNIHDPIRKDEALAIFSLALGSHQALKLGLGLLGDVPLAGVVISVSTNAVILYALGYAACQFYESNLYQDQKQTTLETVQLESQKYLENAIAQETIMDQILVHLILARNPHQTWEKILPQLQNIHLSVHSLEVMSKTINNPPPLNDLLEQLNPDFAIALLAKYQKMVHLSGVKTPGEEQIINRIYEKIKQPI